MKKFLFSVLACAMLLPAVTVQAGGKVTYYGEEVGILRPCKGAPIGICKEVIIHDGGNGDDGRLDPTFPPGDDDIYIDIGDWDWGDMILNPSSYDGNAQVTVICDGMYYECPASWVNWEDGSITPQ